MTFCFNGGPGSSSVWLHLGALGPRRVKLTEEDAAQPAPFGLVDNEFSILHVTDLVFIDPVATGFSRPAEEGKAEQFFGKSPDIESVGEFIRLWTTRHQRWLSPKYVCGESYGVFRAAGLAYHLHSHYGMTLSGLIFVSGVLDFDACRAIVAGPGFSAGVHGRGTLSPEVTARPAGRLAQGAGRGPRVYADGVCLGAVSGCVDDGRRACPGGGETLASYRLAGAGSRRQRLAHGQFDFPQGVVA